MNVLRSAATGGVVLAGLVGVHTAQAAPGSGSLADALTGGTVSLGVRYRYERVDQDDPASITHKANAHTVRTHLGYRTGVWSGFSAFAQAEDITDLGSEDYNNTFNGHTRYPVVADPDGTEVNQAYLAYTGIPATTLRYGRQAIKLDNDRWVGDVGWRQNQQTFDALYAQNQSLPGLTLTYARVTNVNRIFGEDTPNTAFANTGDFDMRSHLANVRWAWAPGHAVTAYGYWLDFEQDFDAESTRTLGLRMTGAVPLGGAGGSPGGGSLGGGSVPGAPGPALLYTAEYARQADHADNPDDFGLDYYLAEAGVRTGGVSVKLGYEVLEGGGGMTDMRAVQSPLATLHAFNGWTDRFLRTPGDGLEDRYITVGGPVPGWGVDWLVRYDDYRAEDAGTDYGSEWGAQLSKTFAQRYTLGVKYARYDTDFDAFVPGVPYSTDVSKLWVWAQLKI